MALTLSIISLVGILITAYAQIKTAKSKEETIKALEKSVPGFIQAVQEVKDASKKDLKANEKK